MECHLAANFFLKLVPEIKVTVAAKLYMYSTPWPQDVSTNHIWDSYVKLYTIYARGTIFLDLMADVKLGYVTLLVPKMH